MNVQPIDFHPPAEEAAAFLLPDGRTLFNARAQRFAALAQGHALEGWLTFMGKLSEAQQQALLQLPALALPDASLRTQARTHGMPPLNLDARPPAWRDALRQIAHMLTVDAPENTQSLLDGLIQAEDRILEAWANRLVQGEFTQEDAAALPFVAAALQVVFTQLASQLDPTELQKMDADTVCPCCGSPAVASHVRLGSAINNLRYLHCSLCNTEWNVPRALCTTCGSDKELSLQEIEGQSSPVRAECCDSCKSYLKIVSQDKDPQVDPVADDLATLTLDLLVDQAGYERAGPNLLLMGAYSGTP